MQNEDEIAMQIDYEVEKIIQAPKQMRTLNTKFHMSVIWCNGKLSGIYKGRCHFRHPLMYNSMLSEGKGRVKDN